MDYGKLLRNAWTIVIQNPYLFLLGILISLTSGGGGSGGSSNFNIADDQFDQALSDVPFSDFFQALTGVAIGVIIALVCLALFLAILLWIAQQVARGGLIAGVDAIAGDRPMSLGDAWRAGWERKWTLLGISLILLIPILILVLVGVVGAVVLFGAAFGAGASLSPEMLFGGTMFGVLGLICLLIPVAVLIGLWAEFAYRACMLEGTGVIASYGRGWHVIFDNIGPVVIIMLIRIAIGIALFIPAAVGSLCCLLWPILLLLNGAVTTYFSTVWTLAWHDFTAPPSEPLPLAVEPEM